MIQSTRRLAHACLALALVAICIAVSAGQAQPPGGPPPAAVVVDHARQEVVRQYREVVGELRALRRALLAAEDEGLVVEFALEEGDTVVAGQVIARLRDTRAEMEVRRSQAELAARRASLAERSADLDRTRRDLVRIDELQLRGSAAQTELEDRRTAVNIAEARLAISEAELAAAEAGLELMQDRLERLTVSAPFDGVVVTKRTELGQWIRQGDAIIEIVGLDQIEARLFLPESLIAGLTPTTSASLDVRVRISATGEVIAAPIAGVIPESDPLSRLIPIRMRLENSGHKLRPGMSIAGLVPTGTQEPSLTIHKDAVLRDDAGEFVYYDAGGSAAVARIQSIFPLGDRVAVRSATLRPGMAVITEGNERLTPGRPLAIVDSPGAPPRTAPRGNIDGIEAPANGASSGTAPAGRTGEGQGR